ncbi:unnamed protein product [Phytophthora lilii]|uniref:Unnamed protein product n=1 Tax=Phytophthora lilii TaxID=2077276 RepID=A0A9W6TLF7_9STRA|nr:unnamed protein product [Phytophthora lilii]
MLKNLASVVPPLLFAMKEVTPPYSNASVRTNSGDARGIIQATRHLMYKKQDRTPIKLRLLKVVHILIAAWGIVLMALHVNASIRTPLSECATKVHPMAGVLPSCYVVNFNCAELGISGSKVDVSKRWSKFDRATAQTLRLLHCSALEFPTSFNEFSGLIQIEIYNSTIVNWDHDNAITKTSHPDMTVLYLIRVNMTDGLLPPGLQSLDFPPGLSQIYFCETNLLAFPDDLDAKWPPGLGLYVENSQLAEIPLSLARLRPLYLIAGGNPITQIPAELFEAVLTYLTLGSTKLTELPQYVMAPSTTIYYLDVTNTEVSFFLSWIDALVEDMFGVMPLVAAGGTPYCSALSEALNGNSENFGAPFQDGYSPILMNASQQNWDLLYQAVDCSTNAGVTQFPLEWWDTIYGL